MTRAADEEEQKARPSLPMIQARCEHREQETLSQQALGEQIDEAHTHLTQYVLKTEAVLDLLMREVVALKSSDTYGIEAIIDGLVASLRSAATVLYSTANATRLYVHRTGELVLTDRGLSLERPSTTASQSAIHH